jgi:RecG-like helicase
VEQRARLAAKAHPPPHVLYMTATPIPRSLALIAHGDLAMVSIAGLPPGRTPVATRALPDTPTNRALVAILYLLPTSSVAQNSRR